MGTPPSPPGDAPAPADGPDAPPPAVHVGGATGVEPEGESGVVEAVAPASELGAPADGFAGADVGGRGGALVEVDESPESQPVEGLDAEDPPEPPAHETEHFGWLPYAVLSLLVLLGLASFLGTLLR